MPIMSGVVAQRPFCLLYTGTWNNNLIYRDYYGKDSFVLIASGSILHRLIKSYTKQDISKGS